MRFRLALPVLLASVVGAGTVALLRPRAPATSPVPVPSTSVVSQAPPSLPANHPAIGAHSPHPAPQADELPAITWAAPADWQSVSNPNAMRLATYRVRGASDSEMADVSVSRAGGSTDANIERWIGQFDDAGRDQRSQRTVSGFKVTVVEVGGTYLGGPMSPGATHPSPRPGWALLGAIVETQGSPYFFKLVGPATTVHAAHAKFLALIDSIRST